MEKENTKMYYVNYQIDGRYHTDVTCAEGDTWESLIQKAEANFFDADFGDLEGFSCEQLLSIVDEHDIWYVDGGIWTPRTQTPPKPGMRYTIGYQIVGRATFDVEADAGADCDDVLDLADSEYCDADFGILEDIGDCDTRPISVEDKDGNFLWED